MSALDPGAARPAGPAGGGARYRFVCVDRGDGLHRLELQRLAPDLPAPVPPPATDSHGYPLAAYLHTAERAWHATAPDEHAAAEADAAYLLKLAAAGSVPTRSTMPWRPERSAAARAARAALLDAAGLAPALPRETPADRQRAGALVRARRLALRLAQRDLAAAAGVSRSALAALEAGQRGAGAVAGGRIAEALARLEAAAQERAANDAGEMTVGTEDVMT